MRILCAIIISLLGLSAVGFGPATAAAQDAVAVRVGAHETYSRLVVDWPQKTAYTLKKDGDNALRVSFSTKADLAIENLNLSSIVNILSLTEQAGEAGTTLTIQMPGENKYRSFTAGNRVIVDIYNGPATAKPAADKAETKAPAAPVAEAEPEKAEAQKSDETFEKEETAAPVKAEVPTPAPAPIKKEIPEGAKAKSPVDELLPEDKDKLRDLVQMDEFDRNTPVIKKKSAAKLEAEAQAARAESDHLSVLEKARQELEANKPYLISLTRTEKVGMATFIRNGRLWMLFDQENVKFAPYVSGPDEETFSRFEKLTFEGGVAYYTAFPEKLADYHVYGEGGGLAWRIVVSQNERHNVVPVAMSHSFIETEGVWGGQTFWAIPDVTKMLAFRDPAVGDLIHVVTVDDANYFTGPDRKFPAYEVLQSVVGMAFVERADDLTIDRQAGKGVSISRHGGLALSREQDVNRRIMREKIAEQTLDDMQKEGSEVKRIFDFDRWMMGGIQSLQDNQSLLMAEMAGKDKGGMVEDLLTLAKLNIANDRGPEAAGFLHLAAMELPTILESPEYIALRGAAYALAGKYALAFRELSNERLKEYGELEYWRAYVLACLEDWNQAQMIMPNDFSVVISYPKELQEKIALKLAEIALRNADLETADGLLSILETERTKLRPSTLAGLDYLKGETYRQKGEYQEAKQLWQPLANPRSYDDLYRVKAGLAMTLLELQIGDIDVVRAINRLERLRYAWRGDELESKVNFTLGQLYLRDRQYLKGLNILRDAAAMRPETRIGQEIAAYMKRYFYELLMVSEDLSPLDAASVYEEFVELTPPGEKGNKVVQKLAERLAEADLLERAEKLLQHQVDYRLAGRERAEVSFRLAAIYLLDRKPKEAMITLNEANVFYVTDTSEEGAQKRHDIALLKARALSQLGQAEEAITRLNRFDLAPDVNRLRADLSWRAGLWEEAAVALQDLIFDEALDPEVPLTEDQAHLILNRAVALNLSNNRVGLANIRERYGKAMEPTSRGRMFDVVTRPRATALFSDKDTIEGLVNEVDIFQDFLKSYRLNTEMDEGDKATLLNPPLEDKAAGEEQPALTEADQAAEAQE